MIRSQILIIVETIQGPSFLPKKSEQIIKLVQNSFEVTLLDTHGILMGFEWTRG